MQKLHKWVALKSLAHDELKKSCKAFKAAHKKRVDKQEEVRDNVAKELNKVFHKCAPPPSFLSSFKPLRAPCHIFVPSCTIYQCLAMLHQRVPNTIIVSRPVETRHFLVQQVAWIHIPLCLKSIAFMLHRYLTTRNFRGRIKVHEEAAKLTIAVQLPGQDQGNKGLTDLKTLSGGERSFVTICFLLALGKKLKANFHCLDEFDVFMDTINRGVSRIYYRCTTLPLYVP